MRNKSVCFAPTVIIGNCSVFSFRVQATALALSNPPPPPPLPPSTPNLSAVFFVSILQEKTPPLVIDLYPTCWRVRTPSTEKQGHGHGHKKTANLQYCQASRQVRPAAQRSYPALYKHSLAFGDWGGRGEGEG